jgi:hypothetical protein
MTNHPKDRHILAAAVRAEVIVTLNLRDFPEPVLKPYDISPTHPDRVLPASAEHLAGDPRPSAAHRRAQIRG